MELNNIPNQNINDTEMPPRATTVSPTENKNTIGPVIGVVVIIAIIIIGGLYFWMKGTDGESPVQNQQQTTLETTVASDSVSDLDASLKANSVDNLDTSTTEIDAAFNQQ